MDDFIFTFIETHKAKKLLLSQQIDIRAIMENAEKPMASQSPDFIHLLDSRLIGRLYLGSFLVHIFFLFVQIFLLDLLIVIRKFIIVNLPFLGFSHCICVNDILYNFVI